MKMKHLYDTLSRYDRIIITSTRYDDTLYTGLIKNVPDDYDNCTVYEYTEIDYREYHITIEE